MAGSPSIARSGSRPGTPRSVAEAQSDPRPSVICERSPVFGFRSGAGRGSDRRSRDGLYMLLVLVLQIALGVLASLVVMWFSRRREYAADAGSARLLGTPSSMIAALRRLGNLQPGTLPDSLRAMGVADGSKTSVWSTHPSLDDRIRALQNLGTDAFM